MSRYEYDNPDDAYAEALRRIKEAGAAATTLDLWMLGLTAVPPEIAQLSNLTVLWLYDNKLEYLPSQFEQLINLRELDIADNQLATISEWMLQLPRLKKLLVKGNPITTPPAELLGQALTKQDKPVNLETGL